MAALRPTRVEIGRPKLWLPPLHGVVDGLANIAPIQIGLLGV